MKLALIMVFTAVCAFYAGAVYTKNCAPLPKETLKFVVLGKYLSEMYSIGQAGVVKPEDCEVFADELNQFNQYVVNGGCTSTQIGKKYFFEIYFTESGAIENYKLGVLNGN